MVKIINVDDKTHSALFVLKIQRNDKSISDTIDYLLSRLL